MPVVINKNIMYIALFLLFHLFILAINVKAAGSRGTCVGPYSGKKISNQEMKKLIEDHAAWLKQHENFDGTRDNQINLCGADLREINLNKMNLSRVDLSWANLTEANLKGVDLTNADLSGANLRGADLSKAKLYQSRLMYTDLSGANLSEADLNNANLLSANLNGAILNSAKAGADFRLADLRRANLIGVDLNAAKLNWANLTESVLDPSAIGDASGFLSVKGLSEIRIENVSSIVELRKKMKEASFTFEEKALTSALRKYQLRYPDYYPVFNLEYWFEGLLLGGFLTDFGAFPEGAFDALIILIFVFFWFYLFALMRPKVKAGIWRLRPSDRIIKEKNESDRELIKWNGL
jgi:uncharacterized protein YjbI with pentapeptide repeats